MVPTEIPHPNFSPVTGLTALSAEAADHLVRAWPDNPFNTIETSIVRRGLARVFVAGPLEDPAAVVVQPPWAPGELGFRGADAEAGWSILRQLPGWFCVNGSTEAVGALERIFERELGLPFRRLDDQYYVLEGPPVSHQHPAVRLLTEADVPLLARAPPSVRGGGFRTFEEMLTEGAAAGAIVDGELVAIAIAGAWTERYADIGVHTLEPWRGQGISSACTYLVAREVQARGRTPIWSTGGHNLASQRVALKVGYRSYGRAAYVVVDALRERDGYRPT